MPEDMKKDSSSAENLPIVNGYRLLQQWSTSGNAQWSFAEKNGREWFIKQFIAPKYKRLEDGISKDKVEKSKRRCEAFKESQEKFYKQIKEANTGNIIAIEDFFCFGTQFYAVSEKISFSGVSIQSISEMDFSQKLILLKVLTHSLNNLHTHGVVHADLKPENILVKKTQMGYTLKLIDFDAGFLEWNPRRGEKIAFDPVYAAPETMVALSDETITLSPKIDIFALGMLFHQYCVGCLPKFSDEYPYASIALLNNSKIELDNGLPSWLRELVYQMLDLEPQKRPSAEDVFQWLTLQRNPKSGKKKIGFHTPPQL